MTPAKSPSSAQTIVVRGAREHNLKDVSLELPRDSLIVFTGISGSGKSSLAFDTIYAEGQRRYVESLSSYARQFLGQMQKPEVDFIEGLSPAISIDQKSASRNPRSTVGTITEIYDYLRLLFARIGKPHCPKCGKPIARQTPEQIVDQVLQLKDGTKFQVLAPVIRGKKGEYETLLEEYARKGFSRAKVDGKVIDLSEGTRLDRYYKHDIDIVVDRLVIKEGVARRLTDSIETALKLAEGIASIELVDGNETLSFSEHAACLDCGISFDELAPRNFSFNTPYGACPRCDGIGTHLEVDADLIVSDPELSLAEGVLRPWGTGAALEYFNRILTAVGNEFKFSIDKPWEDLTDDQREAVLYGTGDRQIFVKYKNKYGRLRQYHSVFEGVIPWLERRHQETESEFMRERIEQFFRQVPCPACKGGRLKPESLAVTIGGQNIFELCRRSVADSAKFIHSLDLTPREHAIADRVLKEVKSRLGFLIDVGLDYLTIERGAATLAGGEAQRIRLATQIGSALVGVLYVLDEPSIGLHQRDNRRLIETLVKLRDLGNTLIVVEHDEETISVADHVVDIGPGAGEHGGRIVYSGPFAGLKKERESLTGAYLSGRKRIEIPPVRRIPEARWITVRGAREHNLKGIDVGFPLGVFTCVTGVSGSGKSTLVNEILYRAVHRSLFRDARSLPGKHRKIEGLDHVDKVIDIDQSPIGRTPRSNPATYTGVFDHIRMLFSQTEEARVRGYKPGRFSFNVKGGRCENCSGDGQIKIEMYFLPDMYVTCEVCKGRRYNRETLDVHYKGKTVSEVLEMSVEEALDFFRPIPQIARHLQTLNDVGLGYVRLGQPAPTLSGGEAQRVKLASELAKRATGRTLYILDEPTTGLHFEDISKLLTVLHGLVSKGNTVIVIEHNLDVIKTADWIIDLGPEGGDLGGEVVVEGTPEHVAKAANSYTGRFLKDALAAASARAQRNGPAGKAGTSSNGRKKPKSVKTAKVSNSAAASKPGKTKVARLGARAR
ncbi:MAG TPA: excinuclease ABC subunit UvrA [Actinomycetota bacterium]|nr:excinuclease ABC subunit UvrA [Actinomycetota bacterium]